MTTHKLTRALLSLAVCAAAGAAEQRKIEIWDQRVAIVNTEAICKRDVEERMGGIAERLTAFKKEKQAAKMWTAEADAEWTRLYVESFRDALRKIVRERLMLQYYTREKMTVDDKNLQKRQANYMKMLHDNGARNVDVADISKRIKEQMMLEEFRGKFDNAMEYPKKPEVEKYYRDNIEKYQRKAGVKVRMIRIDTSVTDKLTGAKKVREKPYEMLEEIRRDVVELGALFSEVAKTKSDDPDSKDRGGLLLAVNNDPYIVPEEYNKILATPTNNLKIGEVSPVFSYGNSYAIAMVEDRREAGPEPLEGKLYEKIYNDMYETKRVRKEDEWFRATLAKTLVMQIVEGNARPLPIEFFFPDDKKNPDFVADVAKAGGPDAKTGTGTETKKNEQK